jgi:NAD(P)-dependent dehydrogenase (short-subunit alcohol dehydrogenase family)
VGQSERRQPGETGRGLHPLDPAGPHRPADDLPGAILFFASDDAAFVTGQVLSVPGGPTMAG